MSNINKIIKIDNLVENNKSKPEDNYKVLSKSGKGSFGSVYKVINLNTGQIRAMKIIKKDAINYQDDERIFLKEIEILKQLSHPNIVKIFEYFTDEVNYYVITEYISGGGLYEAITKTKQFNESKAAYIMSQILSALNYLHSNDIVHRDIKPENILVESTQSKDKIEIKLIDFGTCNYLKGEKNLTLKVGSPYYIAPEVLKKNYNKKCDIWSAGVILYILLIGTPPFKGQNTQDLFKHILNGNYNKRGPEWDALSENAKDLICKMLEYNPDKRFSAYECLNHPWITSLSENNKAELLPSVLENIYHLSEREKFQQATMAYIIHAISTNREIEELKKVFYALDLNKDGKLTYKEIKLGFEKYFGKSISEMKVNKIIESMDNNIDGVISYEEFLRASVNQNIYLNDKNLKLAFEKFDINKDGKLSKDELKKVLDSASTDYLDILIEIIDNNNDGFISYEEFKNFMKGAIMKKNKTIGTSFLNSFKIDNISDD